MIHVAHVTASPCPDKDLPAACIGYALSRQTKYKVKKRKDRKERKEREKERGGRVREDVIFAIEKSIVGIGNAEEHTAARPTFLTCFVS